MKTTMLIAALAFAGVAPALACDYTTHTTAATDSTVVVCDASGCHALDTSASTAQEPTSPTVVAAQADK
jgi:hypothetical protein